MKYYSRVNVLSVVLCAIVFAITVLFLLLPAQMLCLGMFLVWVAWGGKRYSRYPYYGWW